MAVHAIIVAVVHDSPEVKSESTQCSVVGIRKTVDDGVNRIATYRIVFLFCAYQSVFAKER